MKNLSLILGILFSFQSFANDTTLFCNNQKGSAIYHLEVSSDLSISKLVTVIDDSTVLAAGTMDLKYQEGESYEQMYTYSGRTAQGFYVSLLFNANHIVELKPFEILKVDVFYQQQKHEGYSGKDVLLCRIKDELK